MEGIYKINLVSSDLSTEETILQIADVLDNLNGVMDDVFARLTSRINENMARTGKVTRRIDICRDKVAQLTGVQKAIKVFSSAKYPTVIKHEHYKSVFGPDGYKHQPAKVTLSGRTQGREEKDLHEKLHFYHVKVGQPNYPNKPKPNLRNTLQNISTIGELLIFDTDECPYVPTSKQPVYRPSVTIAAEKGTLEAAPSSIVNRELLKREADEYLYAPGMGMVPELDMPLDLPDLPGIAGDIQYSVAGETAIAPSAVTSPTSPLEAPPISIAPEVVASLPDLPDIPDLPPPLSQVPQASLPDIPDAAAVMATVAPPAPPPPPPPPSPPPPPAPPAMPVQDDVKIVERPARGAAPGPTGGAAPGPAGDSRADLMAAIRRAGGAGHAKLRAAADAQKAPPGGGDLMADLHAKLSMRRRGISGSVLHTLAAAIPEPEPASAAATDTEDDWE